MFFKQVEVGEMQNFAYILGDNGEAALVDPGWQYEKILKICKDSNLEIKKILLTHTHFNHAEEIKKICEKTGAEVFVHQSEELSELNVKVNFINDNEIIKVGNTEIKVVHTPGHTTGSLCFLAENKLLTGDTLFVGTVGRTDLPGGNLADMMQSIKKLKKLNDKIEIWPGHDYGLTKSSTIGKEKKINEFMKL